MATGSDVLLMLRPQGGWAIHGNDYENIQFIECEPLTKEEFEQGFTVVDDWLEQKEQAKQAKKAAAEAKLAALGLTADDLKALGLG